MTEARAREWRAAEQALRRDDIAHGWSPGREWIYPHLEFLFTGGLVHRGAVIRGGGLPAMLRYLSEVKALDGRPLEVEAIERLVSVFGGAPWGNRPTYDTWDFDNGITNHPRAIRPKLTLSYGWLVYDVWVSDGGGDSAGYEIVVGPPIYRRYRLIISPSYTGSWSTSRWHLEPGGKLKKGPW